MLVNTKRLNQWTPEGHALNEKAERGIVELAFGDCVKEVTKGNNPGYDVLLTNGTKIEVKYTNSQAIFIETSRYDGTPSGLSKSTADYYLIVHTGYFNKKIGKVKLIPTQTLRDLSVLGRCITKSFEPYKNSPGSKGFYLNKELNGNDGWIGNIDFDEVTDSFDISRFTYRT